jgi:bacillithiol system protein YtxJ
MDGRDILSLDSEEALDEVMLLPMAVLYKHSTRCGTSVRALLEVERFSLGQPEIPVYGIDVIRQRGISDLVARRLDIGHESPQVILVRDGHATWHASHFRVTAAALAAAIAEKVSD